MDEEFAKLTAIINKTTGRGDFDSELIAQAVLDAGYVNPSHLLAKLDIIEKDKTRADTEVLRLREFIQYILTAGEPYVRAHQIFSEWMEKTNDRKSTQ